MFRKTFKAAFPYTIPVMAGYLFLGTAFGLLVRTKGYPIWWASAMSLIIYSGALEYAAVPMLAQTFAPVGSFIFGLMLSARHLFYGLPMLKKYEGTGKMKLPLMLTLTDETFSILSTTMVPDGADEHMFYMVVSLLDYAYWNIGTLVGAVCGDLITFDATGMDFSLTALFIVLFLEQIRSRTGRISGFMGLCVTAMVLFLFGKDNMVVISMAGIAALLLMARPVIEGKPVSRGDMGDLHE